MAIPEGWAQDSQDSNLYNATLTITTGATPQTGAATNTVVKVKVDNSTGNISLTNGNVEFYNYDPTSNSWSHPSDAASKDTYDQIVNLVGNEGINTFTSSAKTGAVNVINATSSEENKSAIREKDGYTSAITNTEAPDAGDANDGGGVLPENLLDDINSGDFGTDSEQRQYGEYAYPSDMFSQQLDYSPDVILFKQKTYGKRGINQGNLTLDRDRSYGDVGGSVMLAIPAGIQDANRANWTDDTLNAIDMALASASLATIEEGASGLQKATETFLNQLAYNTDVQNAAKVAFAAKAAGVSNLLARTQGAILNPNVELLFSGPALRDFAYTIDMSPKDSGEAKQIRNIIRFFKEGMAPRRSSIDYFLKAPNVFDINYMCRINGVDQVQPYANKIKTCALRNCNVEYAPQNTYMTHKEDGSMISYRMTLQFTELEPVFYDDYIEQTPISSDLSNSPLGF